MRALRYVLLLLLTPVAIASAAPEWVAPFADRVVAAWKTGQPMPQLSVAHPNAGLAAGYAIQDLFVQQTIGADNIGAYKAAIVGAAGQDGLGIKGPLTAVLSADGVIRGGRHRIDLADDPKRAVETEIGYVFGMAVDTPLADVRTLRLCVEAIVPVVELPGGATEDTQPATAADLAAWNINAKEIVVGGRSDPAEVNPDDIAISLEFNGTVVNTAAGSDAAGGQWMTLLKTVNTLTSRGYAIEPGQVVSNGALGSVIRAEPGEYRANFGALGTIDVEVGASGE